MGGRRGRLALSEERLGLGHGHGQHLGDVLPAEGVLQHRGVEPLPLAQLAGAGDGGHDPEVGVDDAGTVAGGAGALGVGAEQRRLHAVGLRERLADRVEQPGVGRGVAPPRALDRGLVDRHHPVLARHRAVDQRALPRPGHAGHHHEHAERDVDVDVLQVVEAGPAHLQRCPTGVRTVSLSDGPIVQVPAGEGAAGPQPLDGALEHHLAALGAGARAEVDHVVGDLDRLRLVLHDQHRVALVPELQEQVVHPLDVVGVQPDRRLVEDVRDVGERRAEVADHLRALGLAARQRARRPVEAEVAQPDLHERVKGVPQRAEQRRHRRLVELCHPLRQVADLHRADVGDVEPLDLGGTGRLGEPGAAAVGAGGEGHHPLHERPDVGLHRVDVLGQVGLLDLRDQPRVGQVDAVDLDLGRLLVEQVVELLLGELPDRLVGVEVAAAAVDPAVPAVHAVAGDGERPLHEGLAVVVQLGQVEVVDGAPALAARAHAAGDAEAPLLSLLRAARARS